MTDENTDPPTPSEIVDKVPGTPDDGVDVGEDSGTPDGGGDSEGTGNRIMDALMSTEPEQNVPKISDTMGIKVYEAHGIAGTKKFLNGLFDAGVSKGTTAFEHFLTAVTGAVMQRKADGGGSDESDESSQETGAGEGQIDPGSFDDDIDPDYL